MRFKLRFQGVQKYENVVVVFKIEELFYLDSNDYIIFNFQKYNGSSSPIKLYLGLLFLNKVNWMIVYDK